jgi:hypothetical protein
MVMAAMNMVSAGGFGGISIHLRKFPQGVAYVLRKKTPIFGPRWSKLDHLMICKVLWRSPQFTGAVQESWKTLTPWAVTWVTLCCADLDFNFVWRGISTLVQHNHKILKCACSQLSNALIRAAEVSPQWFKKWSNKCGSTTDQHSCHWLAIFCQGTYLPASVPQDNALAIKGSLVLLITMDAWCCVFTLKLSVWPTTTPIV